MNHRHKRHRTISRIHKKFKNLAAIVASAAILSGAMLPGIPAATVHASPNPDTGKAPVQAAQHIDHDKQSQNNNAKLKGDKAPDNFNKVLDVKATAYAPGPHDNDQWGNKTFTGGEVRPGVVAVDPNIIPLGSTLYLQYPDGHGEYAVAADTGGAIKGHRIDIAKWTVDEAQDFGIQNVKVFVVDSPDNA